jgi:hypothetical protein
MEICLTVNRLRIWQTDEEIICLLDWGSFLFQKNIKYPNKK